MDDDFLKLQLIDRYLRNDLSEKEQIDFEDRVANDPAFAEEVEKYKDSNFAVGLLARIQKKEQVKRLHQQFRLDRHRSRVYPVAALILVLVAVGLTYWYAITNYTDHQLATHYYTPYVVDPTTQGQREEQILDMALAAYNNQDYSRALDLLTSLPENINEYWQVQLLIGNVWLMLDQPKKAIPIFDNISKESELYKESAKWYLALAYLKNEDPANAQLVLKQIQEGEYNYSTANQLLKKLNSPLKSLPGVKD